MQKEQGQLKNMTACKCSLYWQFLVQTMERCVLQPGAGWAAADSGGGAVVRWTRKCYDVVVVLERTTAPPPPPRNKVTNCLQSPVERWPTSHRSSGAPQLLPDTHLHNRAGSGHLARKLHTLHFECNEMKCIRISHWQKNCQLVQRGAVKKMVRDRLLEGIHALQCDIIVMWHSVTMQCVTYDKVLRFCGQMSQLQVETFVYIITVSISMLRSSGDLVWPLSSVCTGEQVASCYTRNSAMSWHCQWRGLSCPGTRSLVNTRARSSYSKYFYSCILHRSNINHQCSD